ncbi:MAG: glycosyltransferase family 9 protein, partial [Pseudomonadota bacterium]
VFGDEIIKITGNSVVNLIGKTNYMQSAEVISRCNLLVSNDCGPVHLAAAVGTAVVGIYASIHFPGAWHPWGKNHRVLRDDSFSCRFCFKTECKTMACINSITAGQVIAACRDYLKCGEKKQINGQVSVLDMKSLIGDIPQ